MAEPMRFDVSGLRGGEDNSGPLESTDLFLEGRGVSLLINVEAGQSFTYSLSVDGQTVRYGSVGATDGRRLAQPDSHPGGME